jgi:hypothetical protein
MHNMFSCGKMVNLNKQKSEKELTMSKQDSDPIAFACDLTALDAQERQRYERVREQLQRSVEKVREVDNGYVFLHSADVSTLLMLAEFIRLESRCYPFLCFALKAVSLYGPAWLTVTGPEGVKEFLRAELSIDRNLL